MCGCAASRTVIRSRPPSPGSTRSCARGAPRLVPLRMAAGRVLATPVVSDVDVPGFDRATMDGYAVVAESTEGATSYNRLPLVGDRRLAAGTSFSRLGRRRPGRSNHDRRAAAARLRRRAARRVDRRRDRDERVRQRPRCRLAWQDMSAERGEDIVRGTTLFQRWHACCARRISACSARSAWERCRCSAGRGSGWS